MPPLEELLRFADAQTNSKCIKIFFLTFPVLTMSSTAHSAPVGEESLSVSNETTAKATSISTIVDDKCPGAATLDRHIKRTPAQVRFRAIEAALSPTRPVPSTQGSTKRSDMLSPVTSPTRPVPSTQSGTKHSDIFRPVLLSYISPGLATPTPDHQANLPVHHFGLKQTAWEEDPEFAPFLSFKTLEEIALGHKINGFVCSNCNHYNRVRESEDEE